MRRKIRCAPPFLLIFLAFRQEKSPSQRSVRGKGELDQGFTALSESHLSLGAEYVNVTTFSAAVVVNVMSFAISSV